MLAAAILNRLPWSAVLRATPRICSGEQLTVVAKRLLTTQRPLASLVLPNGRGVVLITARQSHGPATMQIKAGRYEWDKFKDYMIYYFCLGLVPVGILLTYVNVFVGPTQLAEIPEGYQPQDYEYEKHPITRYLTKNIFVSPQRNYEKMMHYWWEESEKQRFRLLRGKVNEAMALNEDYKSWYYVPATSVGVSRSRDSSEDYYENLGQPVTGAKK